MIRYASGSEVSPTAVKALWDKIPWAHGRDLDTIAVVLLNSQRVVQAWDGDRLVGTARILTDGAYYATLWDVIVDPQYQGQGVGTALVDLAIEPYLGRGFSFIALFAAEGKEAFYKHRGFSIHPRGMKIQEPL